MVRIRLRRVGARHQPSYRIVAADKESPRDGKFLETLGHYNPRTEPSTVTIDEARLFHWLQHGAQPSDALVKVLKPLGTWERWERYKGGEALDALLEEAANAIPEVDPRTRRDDLIEKRQKKKPAKKKEAKPTKAAADEKAEVEEVAEEAPVEEEAPETSVDPSADEMTEVEEIVEQPSVEIDASEEDVEEETPKEESSEDTVDQESSTEKKAEDKAIDEPEVEDSAEKSTEA
jgi:small subunit ribosomal protein S16